MVKQSVKAAAKGQPAGSSRSQVAPVAKSLSKPAARSPAVGNAKWKAMKVKAKQQKQSWKVKSWVTLSAKNLEKLPSTPMLNMLKKSPEHAPSVIEIGSGSAGVGSNDKDKSALALPSVSDEASVDEYMQSNLQAAGAAFTPAEMSLNYGGWANKQIIEGVQARERRRSRQLRRETGFEDVTPSSNRTRSDDMTPVRLNDMKTSKDAVVAGTKAIAIARSKSAKKNESMKAFSVMTDGFVSNSADSKSTNEDVSATAAISSSSSTSAPMNLNFLRNAVPVDQDRSAVDVSPASASSVGSSQKQATAWQGMIYASRKRVDPDNPRTWWAKKDGAWSAGAIRTKQILKWRGQVELTKKGTIKKKLGRPTKEQQAQKAAFIWAYEQQHGYKPSGHAFRNDLSVLWVKSKSFDARTDWVSGEYADGDENVPMKRSSSSASFWTRSSGRRISGELQWAAAEAGFVPVSAFADSEEDANPRNHFLRFVYYAQDLPKSKFSLKSAFAEARASSGVMDMEMELNVSSSSSSSPILSADEVDRNVFTMPVGWHVCDAKTNYLPTVKNDKNKEFPLVVCFSGHVRAVRQFDVMVKAVLEQQIKLGTISRFAVTENVHSGVTQQQVRSGGGSVPVLCSGGC